MKKIEERLTPPAVPEPPEALLERIQKEIPDHLQLVEEESESTLSAWRLRLIAASVAVVVLGSFLTLKVAQEPMHSMGPSDIREVPFSRSVTETDLVDRVASVDTESTASTPPAAAAEEQTRLKAIGYVSKSEHGEPLALESVTEPKRSETQVRQEAPPAASMDELQLFDMVEPPAGAMNEVFADSDAYPQEGLEAQRKPGMALKRVREVPPESQPTASPSTGGTHEPNDAPYGDMFFKGYGTNPFIDTEDDAQSTFGLDVDTGSFTLARSYLERGHLPPSEAIRVEEFVNYFDYGDPAPRRGEFTITAEGGPSPFAAGPRYQLVRFGIKGREISSTRAPARHADLCGRCLGFDASGRIGSIWSSALSSCCSTSSKTRIKLDWWSTAAGAGYYSSRLATSTPSRGRSNVSFRMARRTPKRA